MRNDKLAIAHPGRIGDLLYTLPLARYLHNHTGKLVDIWTSEYCRPAKELFEYQSCINDFIISQDYVLNNWGCGGQPPYINVPFHYDTIFQCGFNRTPDKFLAHWIAESVGVDYTQLPRVSYEYPAYHDYLDIDYAPTYYYVLAPRGVTSFHDTFKRFVEISDLPVIIIGAHGEYAGYGVDMTNQNMLRTVDIISRAKGFVGLMSSQLVLANGFDFPKVAPHDGRSWDMRHVQYSPSNFYPVNPTPKQILELLNG